MYADPELIRSHRVKISLNTREKALVDAYIALTGAQEASFIRSVLMDAVTHAMDSVPMAQSMERSHSSRIAS